VHHYDHAKGGLAALNSTVDHGQLALRLKTMTQGNGREIRDLCNVI